MATFIATPKLRERRMLRGLSLMSLARRAGVEMGNLSRIERGTQAPKPATALRLAEALGLTLEAAVRKGLFKMRKD